jgi:hypothetical protein
MAEAADAPNPGITSRSPVPRYWLLSVVFPLFPSNPRQWSALGSAFRQGEPDPFWCFPFCRPDRDCPGVFTLPVLAIPGRAQDPLDLDLSVDVDDLLDQGRKLIEERLDDRVARLIDGFESGDRTQVQSLLAELERDFGGDYVLDLPRWRRVVAALVPILEEDATTAPYGAWLRSRMDYFEVASELAATPAQAPAPVPVPTTNETGRVTVTVVPPPVGPTPKPGAPAVAPGRRANPTASQQRAAWRGTGGTGPLAALGSDRGQALGGFDGVVPTRRVVRFGDPGASPERQDGWLGQGTCPSKAPGPPRDGIERG